MRTVIALICVAWLSAVADARVVSYAVVIGNNAPPADASGAGLAKLRYADDDAVRYYRLLSQFATTTLLSTLDDPTQKRYPKLAALARVPTLDVLRQVFAGIAGDMRRDRQAGDEPVLYFVFSGHGAIAESGDAFLVLGDGRLTQQVLFDELLASLPSPRTHVIVDACHAGGVVGVRGGSFFDKQADGKVAQATEGETLAITRGSVLERFPNVGVITATTLGNETHEWSAIEAGVFSYEVLSGLTGAADVNGDHSVEYSELQAFIASANRTIANPRAVPMVVSEPPRVDRRATLVRLQDLKQSYLLVGDLGAWGHFTVELEDGQRVLDAHVSREHQAAIALPSGAAVFVRTPHGEARLASHGKPVAAADVKLAPATVAARGGIDADYRDNLFAAAYGPTYYRGFVDSTGGVTVDFSIHVHTAGEDADVLPAPAHDDEAARPWRRGGYALATTAAISGVLAGLSGYYAIRERHDFDVAKTRLVAQTAATRYHEATTMFWITSAVTAAAAFGSWKAFEHAHHLHVAPTASPGGMVGLSIAGEL